MTKRRSCARPLASFASLLVVVGLPFVAAAQVVGDSVNMVSGTQWPGGDPFLQRQNEPSIAVSSANPQHLLAGANDYRSVDVPFVTDATKMAADAWQGVFKSYDGGQTWKSTLMPGYPQDTSWDGTHSAIRGPAGEVLYNASADPVVRAGTDGMFYFAGIVFKRGSNDGRVVVNRFIDLNNKENGDVVAGTDSIQWVDAKVIDQGGTYFADKPWIAVDVPRAGAVTCTITKKDPDGNALFTRSFPGGALYAVWARIYSDVRADVMFSRSLDCGETWSTPLQLNDNKSQASQGVVASVDPRTGDVYVAWRRFGQPNATPPQAEDAIFVARTFSKGRKFTHPRLLTTFVPFEQAQDPARLRFRTEAFPTLASSVNPAGTQSWTHVAWAQRAPNGDGQVVLSQVQVAPPPPSNDEWDDPCDGWKIPAYPIDPAPITDDAGNAFTRGHQFMPQLTFTQGRLVAVYYDSRLDHTRTYYTPHDPCLPYGTCWGPDAKGRWYTEERSPIGERALSLDPADWIDYVTGELDDTDLRLARHSLDVRVAVALPAANPAFTSVALSRLPFGSRGDELPADANPFDAGRDQADPAKRPLSFGAAGHIDVLDLTPTSGKPPLLRLQDLQVNAPNLPMFKNGSVPFLGDYIDVQGPVFVRTSTGWAFDTQPTASPVFHAVWTSNQDVVPPLDGNWKNYAPPGTLAGTTSLVDPGKTVPACVVGNAGSRNQNIYTARISEGLFVSSPQNAKALSTGFLRNFVVSAVNATSQARTFDFKISQPAGAYASFRADGGTPVEKVTVRIPANSSAVQTVSMKLLSGGANPATLAVNVVEVGGAGLAGAVILNPPGLTFDLTQPDGSSASIAAGEALTVTISAAHLSNANLSNANLSNANLSNANLSNANLSNANLSNANLSNTTIDAAHLSNANLSNANLSNTSVSSANLSNANLSNANLSNANLSNANLSNASITDLDYAVTNTGNTTQAFDVRLLTVGTTQAVQLLVSRGYTKPIANGCDLQEAPDNRMVVNAGIVTPAAAGSVANQDPLATFAIAPGETIQVTLRTIGGVAEARTLGTQIAPVVTPQGNTAGTSTALVVATPPALPTAQVGTGYSQALVAQGGTGTVAWTVASGSTLPSGLSLTTGGLLSGTPKVGGAFSFTVEATDGATPPNLTQKDMQIVVQKGTTTTSLGVSTGTAFYGDLVTLTATVAPGSGQVGTVTFQDGTGVLGTAPLGSGGTATLSLPSGALPALPVGLHALSATYGGDAGWDGSSSSEVPLRVIVRTTLLLSTDPLVDAQHPFAYGGSLSILAALGPIPPGAPAPTGDVAFLAQGTSVPSLGIVSGVAASQAFRPDAGSLVIAASYAGDVNYAPVATQQRTLSIGQATPSVDLTSTPNPANAGASVTFKATVTSTAGTPVGSVTFYDGTASLGTVPLAVDASTGKPTATVTTSTLSVGRHTVSAWYEGSTNFAATASSISVLQDVISTSTTTTLAASPNPVLDDKPVTFTATVKASGVVPVGSVSFYDGSKLLGTVTLVASATTPATATASLTKTSMSEGTHTITAVYAGNGTLASSTSAPLSLKVLEDYSCSAYDTPLRSAGTVSSPTSSGSFTFGTKVAVKWRFKKPTGVYVSRTTAVKKLEAVQDALCNGKPSATARRILLFDPVAGAAAGSTFVYDTVANQYKLTWDTSKASKGCWDIVLTPDNGIPQVATYLKLQ